MSVVRIIKWLIIVKSGLILLEDCSVLERLTKLSSDVTAKRLKGIRGEDVVGNFQSFRMLKDIGYMNKKKVIKEFLEYDEVGLDDWLNQNIVLENTTQIIPAKILLIRQVTEALYWRILVNVW